MKAKKLSKLELYEENIARQEAYIQLLNWRYTHAKGDTDTLHQLNIAKRKLTKLKAQFKEENLKDKSFALGALVGGVAAIATTGLVLGIDTAADQIAERRATANTTAIEQNADTVVGQCPECGAEITADDLHDDVIYTLPDRER